MRAFNSRFLFFSCLFSFSNVLIFADDVKVGISAETSIPTAVMMVIITFSFISGLIIGILNSHPNGKNIKLDEERADLLQKAIVHLDNNIKNMVEGYWKLNYRIEKLEKEGTEKHRV